MAVAKTSIDVVIGAKAMYEATLKKSQSDFDKYGKAVVAIFVKINIAMAALRKSWDLAADAAKFDQQEQAFTNLAASHGANARQIINNLKAISGHTVSTSAIMQSAGTAMTLGIPAEHLEKMMEISIASAKVMGESTEVMFEKLTVGLARLSKLRLDDLGILLDTEKANKDYANTMGIVSRALTDTEKKQAFLNAAMESGQDIIDRVGKSTFSAADAQAQFTATIQDLKIVAGKVIITITSSLSGVAFAISKVFAQTLKTSATAIGKLDQLMGKLPFYKATPGILEFADAQGMAAKEADRLMKQSFGVATAIWKEKEAFEGLAKSKTGGEPKVDETTGTASTQAQAEADKLISIQQEKFRRIHEMAVEADLNDREMSALKLMRQLEEFEADRVRLAEAELLTTDLKAQFLIADEEVHLLHEQRLTDIEAREKSKRIGIEQNYQKLKFQTAVTGFGNLLVLTKSNSKAAFRAVQLLNVGTAIMDSKAAVVGAYKHGASIGGPVLGAGYALAAAAANAPLIAAITSASLATGGGGGGGGGGGAVPSIPSPTPDTGSLIGAGINGDQPGTTINVHLRVEGMISPDNLSRVVEEHVAPELERYSERGGQIKMNVISPEAA